MFGWTRWVGKRVGFVYLLVGFVACGQDPRPEGMAGTAGAAISKNCGIQEDQLGAFMIPLPFRGNSIQVRIDREFNESQIREIYRAIDHWNHYSALALGGAVFHPVIGEMGRNSVPNRKDDCSFSEGSSHYFSIVREESPDHWESLGLGVRNPGVTIRCQQSGRLIKQVILLFPEYVQPVQFMSVVLHELGHALGLNHSCNPSQGQWNYAYCGSIQQGHPYWEAVMFPTLRVGGQTPEIKETLMPNDKTRTSCLYRSS